MSSLLARSPTKVFLHPLNILKSCEYRSIQSHISLQSLLTRVEIQSKTVFHQQVQGNLGKTLSLKLWWNRNPLPIVTEKKVLNLVCLQETFWNLTMLSCASRHSFTKTRIKAKAWEKTLGPRPALISSMTIKASI